VLRLGGKSIRGRTHGTKTVSTVVRIDERLDPFARHVTELLFSASRNKRKVSIHVVHAVRECHSLRWVCR
jgi:hypothetical protein